MGTYTSNLKFYKPESTEFVDVESQLNSNWRISDTAVKRLLEYELTDAANPPVAGALNRSKFYKRYSNALVGYKSSGSFQQDNSARVSTWNRIPSLVAPYVEHPDWPICWRLIIKTSGLVTTQEIEWTGALWADGGALPQNVNVTGLFTLHPSATPVVSKYFTVNAGNTAANYSIARLGFFSTGDVQFKRYGQLAGSTTDENRVEFSGIKYNIEAAA